jgi:hypothetical protein
MTEFKNEFSWSKTRDEIFKICPRQYWFAYYVFGNGWLKDAPERTRKIYVLKNLNNRHAWDGAARPISAVAMSLAVFLLVSALIPAFKKKREKIETEAG